MREQICKRYYQRGWQEGQVEKVLAAQPDNPSCILRTPVVEERTSSCRLASDLHRCMCLPLLHTDCNNLNIYFTGSDQLVGARDEDMDFRVMGVCDLGCEPGPHLRCLLSYEKICRNSVFLSCGRSQRLVKDTYHELSPRPSAGSPGG